MEDNFIPAFGMKNKHVQTLYPFLFKKEKKIDYEVETFELSDGDFIECFWKNTNDLNAPLVVLFHGLTGSYKSSYMYRIINTLFNENYNTVVVHFRGCGDKQNLKPRAYHSGDTDDALEFILSIKKRFSFSKIFGVGYSVGGNMLLKLLAHNHELLDAAISISSPLELDKCANKINKGFSKFYQKHLLSNLKETLLNKYEQHDMQKLIHINEDTVKKIKTFWEFDALYTAKIHNFLSVEHYYKTCSSRQYLKKIQTPTLIINAADDPFTGPNVFPKKSELSDSCTFELHKYGGHVGFISGSFFKPKYWLDARIVKFLNNFRKT